MRTTRQSQRSQDTITRRLQLARRCVDLENLPRAERLLTTSRRLDLRTEDVVAQSVIRIACCVVERQFSKGFTLIAQTRAMVRDQAQEQELDLLEAHLAALAGDSKRSLRRIAPLLRAVGDHGELRARGLWIVGLACYRRGHYQWARACFEMSAACYKLMNKRKNLAHVLINLALIEKSEGRVGRALAHLDDAALLLPKRYNSTTRFRLFVNRGICLLKLGDLEGSRNCLMTARTVGADTSEPVFLAMIYNNLGHIYRLEQNYAVATEFHDAALALATREGSTRQQCLAHEFLGETFTDRGDPTKALEHLTEAHRLASVLAPHGDLMMEVARRRGEAYTATGQQQRAIEDLNRAITISRSRGETRELALSQRAMAFASPRSPTSFSDIIRDVLAALNQVGDHFEYARTVCLAMEDDRFRSGTTPAWIHEPLATAQHYFATMNLKAWQGRIHKAAGGTIPEMRMPALGQSVALVEKSHSFATVVKNVRLAANTSDPVLIQGETGAGKEVVARLTHSLSDRRDRSFVAINCGAIPENLVESELFGHAQGAFTGASKDKPGLLEVADRGTVLLDEIVDLPLHAQVKLLRFLDSGEFRRVGETKPRRSDARILASTNRDLPMLVTDGKFRADLYYRLEVFRIPVPPLRQRQEDILDLAEHFLNEASRGGSTPIILADLKKWLLCYEWPGNVRQLRNVCRYLFVRAWGTESVGIEHLPPDLRGMTPSPNRAQMSAFERERDEFERNQIGRALRETRGNISKAATLLGVGRNSLSRKIKTLGLDRTSFY